MGSVDFPVISAAPAMHEPSAPDQTLRALVRPLTQLSADSQTLSAHFAEAAVSLCELRRYAVGDSGPARSALAQKRRVQVTRFFNECYKLDPGYYPEMGLPGAVFDDAQQALSVVAELDAPAQNALRERDTVARFLTQTGVFLGVREFQAPALRKALSGASLAQLKLHEKYIRHAQKSLEHVHVEAKALVGELISTPELLTTERAVTQHRLANFLLDRVYPASRDAAAAMLRPIDLLQRYKERDLTTATIQSYLEAATHGRLPTPAVTSPPAVVAMVTGSRALLPPSSKIAARARKARQTQANAGTPTSETTSGSVLSISTGPSSHTSSSPPSSPLAVQPLNPESDTGPTAKPGPQFLALPETQTPASEPVTNAAAPAETTATAQPAPTIGAIQQPDDQAATYAQMLAFYREKDAISANESATPNDWLALYRKLAQAGKPFLDLRRSVHSDICRSIEAMPFELPSHWSPQRRDASDSAYLWMSFYRAYESISEQAAFGTYAVAELQTIRNIQRRTGKTADHDAIIALDSTAGTTYGEQLPKIVTAGFSPQFMLAADGTHIILHDRAARHATSPVAKSSQYGDGFALSFESTVTLLTQSFTKIAPPLLPVLAELQHLVKPTSP